MDNKSLKSIIEGLLFASGDDGVTVKSLSRILKIAEKKVVHLLNELADNYEHQARGIMIMQSHQTYHLTTKPEHSEYLKELLEIPQSSRLSQAGLETLAIIAYQQPITRAEIEDIRGVNSDRPVQTLVARSLIEEVGRKDAIGRPVLFGTSKDFLIYFGLTSLEELPPLEKAIKTDEIEKEADLFFEQFNELEEKTEGSFK